MLLIGSVNSAALPLGENTGFCGASAIAGRSLANERWSLQHARAVGLGQPALALVDDHRGRELAAGVLLDGSSVLTDSALPGRNETVSFCCASSNLPAKAPPTIAGDQQEDGEDDELGPPAGGDGEDAGHVPSVRAPAAAQLSSASSSSGSVTGRWHMKRSQT